MDIILQAKTLEKKRPFHPWVWDCPSCGKKVSSQREGVYYQVIGKGFSDQRVVYTACSVPVWKRKSEVSLKFCIFKPNTEGAGGIITSYTLYP